MKREYRSVPAEEVLARFPPKRQARINARAFELLAEEVGLADLRRAQGITQEDVARKLGSRQVQISRLEKRADLKLSTLEKYFAALGAKLEILAFFPDSGPFRLARLAKRTSRRGREQPSRTAGRRPKRIAKRKA